MGDRNTIEMVYLDTVTQHNLKLFLVRSLHALGKIIRVNVCIFKPGMSSGKGFFAVIQLDR